MNLKERVKSQHKAEGDLDLMPVMNLFLILVPFLLVAAEFVSIAILEMSLPQLNRAATSMQQPAEMPKQAVLSMLAIRDDGFELKSPTFDFPFVPKSGADYDYGQLATLLGQIKQKFPEAQDVVVAPADEIKYDIVIQVMDRCRESGFPNISISG